MKYKALPLILLLAGCVNPGMYSTPGSTAHTASETHIKAVMDGTYANYGSNEELVFSNIYSIRSIDQGGYTNWQVCSLFRGNDWPPGTYKQAYLQRGITTITDSNSLTGNCNPSRYYNSSSSFTMKSGVGTSGNGSTAPAATETAEDAGIDENEVGVEDDSVTQGKQRAEITQQQEELAKNTISEILKDEESARFRNLYVVENKGRNIAVCGEVNAKNSFGGYTGYSPFMILEDGHRPYMWNTDPDGYKVDNMMIEAICQTE